MEHNYEENIKCPYCDWEENNSWTFEGEEDIYTCDNCEKEFNVTKSVSVSYSTSRLSCEDVKDKHDFELEYVYIRNQRFVRSGEWAEIPKNEWGYVRIERCVKCGEKKYIDIDKDEYNSYPDKYKI